MNKYSHVLPLYSYVISLYSYVISLYRHILPLYSYVISNSISLWWNVQSSASTTLRDFHLQFFLAQNLRAELFRYYWLVNHFTLEVFLFVQENQNHFDFPERTKIVRAKLTLWTNLRLPWGVMRPSHFRVRPSHFVAWPTRFSSVTYPIFQCDLPDFSG